MDELEQKNVYLEAIIRKLQGKVGELVTAIASLELNYEAVMAQLNESNATLEKLKVNDASE